MRFASLALLCGVLTPFQGQPSAADFQAVFVLVEVLKQLVAGSIRKQDFPVLRGADEAVFVFIQPNGIGSHDIRLSVDQQHLKGISFEVELQREHRGEIAVEVALVPAPFRPVLHKITLDFRLIAKVRLKKLEDAPNNGVAAQGPALPGIHMDEGVVELQGGFQGKEGSGLKSASDWCGKGRPRRQFWSQRGEFGF